MPVLAAFDVFRFFHAGAAETLALRGVSLAVEAGEMVAVAGPSGSGKSTLIACLAGLDEPDGGYVELLGKCLTRKPEAERARARAASIGVMMQSDNLFPTLTVVDNILLAMRLARRIDLHRIELLLFRMGLLERRDARPHQLSGGELARAGLAVALAAKPAVLLADEPTGEVDARTEASIVRLLHDECTEGTAVLIATHSAAISGEAHRLLQLRDGRIADA
ncbi:ABC transporter ATP-binding protein [Paraburkholderia sp. SIMBA_054]|uniref:ABC transporter ATP-binding protein n=1 Tax=Paraburkholderia sp. SIMBA_054 TaxID=3085795 RepID=UPI00397C464A